MKYKNLNAVEKYRWRELRNVIIKEKGQICDNCKVWQPRSFLRLHHKDYSNDYFDRDNIMLLCITCHKRMHQDLEFFNEPKNI